MKNRIHVLVLVLLLAIVNSAQAQKKVHSPNTKSQVKQTQPTDSLKEFRESFIKASEDYKASLQTLLTLYDADVKKRTEAAAQLKQLYADGLISRVDYEASSNDITQAQARADEVRQQIAKAEMTIAEAKRPLRPDELGGMVAMSESSTSWTTGNARIDSLIRENGKRFGVDPYLVYCVIRQESRFNSIALSVKGAQGLMQLMPGTAARYGVTNSNDPAQNIRGGTRYLKDLLQLFHGRIDLVLAGYNAGEGAVIKYGQTIPPYKETRDYVRLISKRYLGQPKPATQKEPVTGADQK
ncbi:MAG TPA: lytic transglycosylase domain-containing protein [Pyrinomonadaceae bacterium]|jgi:soluble lytic murein transglycosylase-like protein